MRERPILFSGPMVRAIQAGHKTQTRRISKHHQSGGRRYFDQTSGAPRLDVSCPYGRPGDRLWVRESFDFLPAGGHDDPQACEIVYWADGSIESRSAPPDYNPTIYSYPKIRPSIHMPRWASRITLEITGVRVERLNDISEADALAEGIMPQPDPDGGYSLDDTTHYHAADPRVSFASLWETINGPGSFASNPFVWVVEFRRLQP